MPSDFSALVRYALPGSVLSLVVLLPHILAEMLPVSQKSPLFDWLVTQSTTAAISSAVLVSVPIGYILYQIYFFFYWILAEHQIFGAWQFIPEETVKGTSMEPVIKTTKSFHEKWLLVEGWWYVVLATAQSKDAISLLTARAVRLFDMYHSLGTATCAVFVGIVINAFMVPMWSVIWQWGVLLPFTLIVLGVLVVIDGNRKYARHNIVRYQNSILRTLGKGITLPSVDAAFSGMIKE